MGEHGGAKQLRAAQAVPHDGHPQSGSARGMGPPTKGSRVLQGWWGLQGDQEVDGEWHPAPAPRGSILRIRSQSSTSRTGPLPTRKDLPANVQEESCSGSDLNCAVN